ncbi:MAG: Sec-independent protein translocase protein TatB [Deltaproteobacteria bacterium]|nr:Sec-independent protein translocase protein TatB [Deltaproteobacteria bacterium]
MFGIGIPELIVIMVIALIVIGPEKLPDIAKTLGKALSEFKNVVDGVKTSMEEEQENIEKSIDEKPDRAYTMSLGDKEEALKKDYKEALSREESKKGVPAKSAGKGSRIKKESASAKVDRPKKTRIRKAKDDVVKEA